MCRPPPITHLAVLFIYANSPYGHISGALVAHRQWLYIFKNSQWGQGLRNLCGKTVQECDSIIIYSVPAVGGPPPPPPFPVYHLEFCKALHLIN